MLMMVTAIGGLVMGYAFYLQNDMRRHLNDVNALQKQEHVLHLAGLLTADLLIDISSPADGGSEDPVVAEWEDHLTDLVELEKQSQVAGEGVTSPSSLALALGEVAGLRVDGASPQAIDDFVSRLESDLYAIILELQTRLDELATLRLKHLKITNEHSKSHALWLLSFGLLAFVVCSLVVGRFVVRLVKDLHLLGRRAEVIMTGDYGGALRLSRKDEVGQLARNIDDMAAALDKREQELEEFRRRFFQQEKMFLIGSFASGIAHDIGNPVQAISAICESARRRLSEDSGEEAIAEVMERMEMVIEQATRLSMAIREIGDFARPGPAEMMPTDINQVISSAIQLLRFDHRFREIALSTDLDGDLPMVYAVPDHLTQVMMNVLINAADAITDGDGRIVVATRTEDTGVAITLTDNGRGMPAEVVERVLEPFFTTKPQGKGTGLGLAICKTIIDDHRGTLSIDSTPGEGTVLEVRIPFNAEGRT